MSAMPRRLTGAFVWAVPLGMAIAALWLWTGGGKLADFAGPGSTAAPETWAQRFPAWLVGTSALAEVAIGLCGVLGRWRTMVLAGLVMLALFSGALVMWPPRPGEACGCMGSSGAARAVEGLDPLIRNGVLAAGHLLLWVLVMPSKRGRARQGE
ncbi:MAG: hypothetical protein JNK35_11240 [Phycisphaerae bacterium]|nr:hypothetical protein [Phycisphaerae bacterium]